MTNFQQAITDWILNELSTPVSLLNNLPKCPYAKKAALDGKLLFYEHCDDIDKLVNDIILVWNDESTEVAIINLGNISSDMLENMVKTAAVYAPEESEPDILGLSLTSSKKVKPPRLTDAPVAIECERMMSLSLSSERSILLGRAVGVFAKNGLIDATTLNVDWSNDYPIARLFADRYAEIGRIRRYSIPKPQRAHQKKD